MTVTVVPWSYSAWFGFLVTLPLPVVLTESAYLFTVKVAVTVFGASISTFVGLVEPVASPLQLVNDQPNAAVAVSCTFVPEVYAARFGFFATVPLPTVFTVST